MSETYRGLDKLSPNFQKKVQLWLEEVGDKIFVTESWRSDARQTQLYAQGRTQPGKVVTWVTHSNHQDGLAIDIAFKGSELYPSNISEWNEIVDSAKKYGINWGGDWPNPNTDKPHFEDNGKDVNLYINNIIMKYTAELQAETKQGFIALFQDHTGNDPLPEGAIKNLLEVGMARLERRMRTRVNTTFGKLIQK